jgi:TetR/AcrR family transcriptional regulator, transcriptional repressor for nem operon
MPRPREFNEQQVLDRIADLFTEHGYQGTSISMLTNATGMGKQSLYNSFGDKQSLYLQAVDYSAARFAQRLGGMQTAATGRMAIEVFFSVLSGVCSSKSPAENNCIISSGLLEAISEESIPEKLKHTWLTNHHYLKQAIERGQRDGSIRTDLGSVELADILMTLMSGLRVSARVIRQKAVLKKIVTHSLEVLHPIK